MDRINLDNRPEDGPTLRALAGTPSAGGPSSLTDCFTDLVTRDHAWRTTEVLHRVRKKPVYGRHYFSFRPQRIMHLAMDISQWDRLEARIAELTLTDSMSLEAALAHLCRSNPVTDASLLLLATISFATHLDHYLSTKHDDTLRASHHRYRVIAALAADIALLPAQQAKTCRALYAFWQETDNCVFLDAGTRPEA